MIRTNSHTIDSRLESKDSARSEHSIRFDVPAPDEVPVSRSLSGGNLEHVLKNGRTPTPPVERRPLGQRLSRSFISLAGIESDPKEKERESARDKEKEKEKEKERVTDSARDREKERDELAFKEGPPVKRIFRSCKALVPNPAVNQKEGDNVTIEISVAGVRVIAADPGSLPLPEPHQSPTKQLRGLFKSRRGSSERSQSGLRTSLSQSSSPGSASTSPEASPHRIPDPPQLDLEGLADVEEGAPDDFDEDNDWSIDSMSCSSLADERIVPPQDRLVPITAIKSCWAKGDVLHFKWRRGPGSPKGSVDFEVESYTCDLADDAMLLFGRMVTYLVSKKKHKEKEVLGSARVHKEKREKKDKDRGPAPRFHRVISVAPMKQVPYAAGVTFTLGVSVEGVSLQSAAYSTRAIPITDVKSFVARGDKVHVVHLLRQELVEEVFFCDDPWEAMRDFAKVAVWLAKEEKRKNRKAEEERERKQSIEH